MGRVLCWGFGQDCVLLTSSRVTKIHLQMTTKQGQLLRLQESVGCCGSPEKAEVPAGGQI